ncbi:MAG: metal-dependent hydrolase [Dehalococcoidia bacterium]|nr:metal-dependent hydrolase [Dehalococcoidia bacterium]
MLVLAHAGIALGAVLLVEKLSSGPPANPGRAGCVEAAAPLSGRLKGRAGPFVRSLDLRFLLLGAVLPDMIDKPIGQYFFRETFSNGRIFSHSLLFFVVMLLAGLIILRVYHKTWILALALGLLTHLFLDGMWAAPETLLWPLFGSFPREDLTEWTARILHDLFVNPAVYFFEYVGALVVGWAGVRLFEEKRLGAFLRNGLFFPESVAHSNENRVKL